MDSRWKVVILSILVLLLSVVAAYWNLIDPDVLGRILAAAMALFGLAEVGVKFAEGYKARVATDPNAKEVLEGEKTNGENDMNGWRTFTMATVIICCSFVALKLNFLNADHWETVAMFGLGTFNAKEVLGKFAAGFLAGKPKQKGQ